MTTAYRRKANRLARIESKRKARELNLDEPQPVKRECYFCTRVRRIITRVTALYRRKSDPQ